MAARMSILAIDGSPGAICLYTVSGEKIGAGQKEIYRAMVRSRPTSTFDGSGDCRSGVHHHSGWLKAEAIYRQPDTMEMVYVLFTDIVTSYPSPSVPRTVYKPDYPGGNVANTDETDTANIELVVEIDRWSDTGHSLTTH